MNRRVRTGRRLARREVLTRGMTALVAGLLAPLAVPREGQAAGRWWSSLVWAVFENHGFDQVAGLPTHRRLAREGAVLTRYFAVAHPSGPNYRAMASGETWGDAETIDTFHPSVGSVLANTVPTYIYHLVGEIDPEHNPLVDLHAPVKAQRRGLDTFAADLAAGTLRHPSLAYVGWGDDDNMHEGDLPRGDRNLAALLNALASSRWWHTPDEAGRYPALFFCYDEDNEQEGNHVFASWWGDGVKTGFATATRHTHYGFCRTMTDNWGAAPLGRAAAENPIIEVWK